MHSTHAPATRRWQPAANMRLQSLFTAQEPNPSVYVYVYPSVRYLCWDDYFMAVAFLSAERSKDPNKQVGQTHGCSPVGVGCRHQS